MLDRLKRHLGSVPVTVCIVAVQSLLIVAIHGVGVGVVIHRVEVGRVVVALASPLGPAAAAQLTRSGSLGLSNFRG